MTQPDVITNPCGCNQPGAVHERGDQAFCRAWHAADIVVRKWRDSNGSVYDTTDTNPLWAALDELERVWTR